MILDVALRNDTLSEGLSLENHLVLREVFRGKDAVARERVALQDILLLLRRMTGNTFRNDLVKETGFACSIILQYIVCRSFVAVFIECRAGEVDLQEVNLVVFVDTEVHATVADASK